MTEDINRLFRSAVEAHDSGRGDKALELYVTVLQRAPQHLQATFRLAMLVSQAGRADEAAWLLEKAIELEPRNGEFRFRFGQVLARYPGDDLSRLEAGLRNLGSPSKPAWKGRTDNVDAKRRPALLNFPDLPDPPWFESDEFAWAEHVESATSIVHDELARLLASQAEFTPYCTETDSANVISAAGTDFSSLAGSMSWNALNFVKTAVLSIRAPVNVRTPWH